MSKLFELVDKSTVRRYIAEHKKDFAGKYFDMHVHTFSYKDVPSGFIGIRLPWTKRFMHTLSKILDIIIFWSKRDKLSKLSNFVDTFSKEQKSIFDDLRRTYRTISTVDEHDMAYVTICMNMRNSVKGTIDRTFIDQVSDLRSIIYNNPKKLLFFSHIDGNNIDYYSLATVINDFECSGIKLYPSLGHTVRHPNLYDVYRFCEHVHLPIMVHTSSASTKTSKHFIRVKELRSDGTVSSRLKFFLFRESYRKFFNDPSKMESVIKTFPTLKVCFAHFGGMKEWDNKLMGKKSWFDTIVRLIEQNDNVYADISYTLVDTEFTRYVCNIAANNPKLQKRIMYGSDYYMILNDSANMNHMIAQNIRIMSSYGVLEDFMKHNVHRYLFEAPAEA